jgi:hypothetical protein
MVRSYFRRKYLLQFTDSLYSLCSYGSQGQLRKFFLPLLEKQDNSSQDAGYDGKLIRHLLSIRNFRCSFMSTLHYVCCYGNYPVLEYLKPSCSDVLSWDRKFNSAIHYSMMFFPSVKLLNYLSNSLQFKYSVSDLIDCGLIAQNSREVANILRNDDHMREQSIVNTPIIELLDLAKSYTKKFTSADTLSVSFETQSYQTPTKATKHMLSKQQSHHVIADDSLSEPMPFAPRSPDSSGTILKSGWLKKVCPLPLGFSPFFILIRDVTLETVGSRFG